MSPHHPARTGYLLILYNRPCQLALFAYVTASGVLNLAPSDARSSYILCTCTNLPAALHTMAHANETLCSIDLKIRTLSFLISKLNQRIESPKPLQSSPALRVVACNHIAILLTRGIEDPNGPICPGRKGVAVSGRLASRTSFTVSADADDDPAGALSTTIVAQNPTPKHQPKFKINTLKPSPTRLEDMAAPPYVPGLSFTVVLTQKS